MELDVEYFNRLLGFFNKNIGEKFNLQPNMEPVHWIDGADMIHSIKTIETDDIEKFIWHVKYYIRQKNEDYPGVEFDETYTRIKIYQSPFDSMLCKRYMALPERQRGVVRPSYNRREED